jgi:hypothetical protein
MNREMLNTIEEIATALGNCSLRTRSGIRASRTGAYALFAMPCSKARATSHSAVILSDSVRMPRTAAMAAMMMCITMDAARVLTWSTRTPKNGDNRIAGMNCAAATTPTTSADSLSCQACQPSASRWIHTPSTDRKLPYRKVR